LPVVISFTVETDGRLPSGQSVAEALAQVDGETDAAPAYYMINCAHPTHFEAILDDAAIRGRVRGLRANASMLSHAELDDAETLDRGDPDDLAIRYAALLGRLPNVNVFGGCCGTDLRHVTAIARAVAN
jgi:S-methylmethionine-dependent homocysteine/selenocysteine methylase